MDKIYSIYVFYIRSLASSIVRIHTGTKDYVINCICLSPIIIIIIRNEFNPEIIGLERYSIKCANMYIERLITLRNWF